MQYFLNREQVVWKIHIVFRLLKLWGKSSSQLDKSQVLCFHLCFQIRFKLKKIIGCNTYCCNHSFSDVFQCFIEQKACNVSLLPTSFQRVRKPRRRATSKVFKFGATSALNALFHSPQQIHLNTLLHCVAENQYLLHIRLRIILSLSNYSNVIAWLAFVVFM